jgi:hypothetical protein
MHVQCLKKFHCDLPNLIKYKILWWDVAGKVDDNHASYPCFDEISKHEGNLVIDSFNSGNNLS